MNEKLLRSTFFRWYFRGRALNLLFIEATESYRKEEEVRLARIASDYAEREISVAEIRTMLADELVAVAPHAEALRNRFLRKGVPENLARPPANSEYLLFLFYNHAYAEALCGDLEERFPRMVRKFGYRKAWFWFWWQTLGSVGTVAWAWMTPKILCFVSALRVARIPLGIALAWMVANGWINKDSLWNVMTAITKGTE